ncbi:MAG: hypothetical protein ABII72_00785, partial [Parcubacteria group bacterium]
GIVLVPPFLAYPKEYRGGVNITVADLQGTNLEQEIITSPMNGRAHVRIFDRSGEVISSFFAREQSFQGNTIVKVANLDGSDQNAGDLEIIVLCSDGVLKVFNKEGEEIMPPTQTFLPYLQDLSSNGSLSFFDLGVADIENNNGAKEVIVSDRNSIMIYGKDRETQKIKQITPAIMPFSVNTRDHNQGVVFSAGDLDGAGEEQGIVVGSQHGSSLIQFFNKDGRKIKPDFYAYDPNYTGGIDLIVSDLDGTDNSAEIVTVAQTHSAHIRIFNKEGQPVTEGFMAYPEHTNGRTKITAANLNNDENQGGSTKKNILVSPTAGSTQNRFFSKDSRLLNPGWYLLGTGEEIDIAQTLASRYRLPLE